MKLVSTEDLGLCYSTIIFYPLYLSIFTVSCILQEKKQIQLNFIDYILQLYLLQYKLQVTTEIHAFYVKTTFQTPDKFRVYMRTTGFVMLSSILQNYLSDIAFEIHKCKQNLSLIKNTLATFSLRFQIQFDFFTSKCNTNYTLVYTICKEFFYH